MFKNRVLKLMSQLKDGEAVLISNYANRLYYTGMNSSAGTVVVTNKKACLFIDFRYFEKAKSAVTSMEIKLCDRLLKQLSEFFSDNKITTVYTEVSLLSVKTFVLYKNTFEGVDFTYSQDIENFILTERSVKSPAEICLIKEAQRFTDETFKYILNEIKVGVSEKEIMLRMEFFMRRLGSEGIAFDTIVVSGKNSSLPHGVPTDKQIESGDFVTMDFGAVYGGYRSDMTRTVGVGFVTDKQKEVYATVLSAQEAALKFIRKGVRCCDADKCARDIIKNAGYGDCFGHGLGHSVGIEIHEEPACNTRCETIMQEGLIMTVEPGIYIENQFGVRIEDMVLVTNNGIENLTASPKELIIL